MWCIEYGLWHIFMFNFKVLVVNWFLLRWLDYLASLWLWSQSEWWITSLIYNASILAINSKIWVNFKIDTYTYEYVLWKWSGLAFWFWVKKYNSSWVDSFSDGKLDYSEIDYVLKNTRWSGHHMVIFWGYIIDSRTTKIVSINKDVLKRLVDEWIIRNTFRTVSPNDIETANIVKYTRQMFKAEKNGKIDLYMITNKDNKTIHKAYKLYNFWRK